MTTNAYIGLWFAVQPEFRNGLPVDDAHSADGRLFAVDITNRLINEIDPPEEDDEDDSDWTAHRGWEDMYSAAPSPSRCSDAAGSPPASRDL